MPTLTGRAIPVHASDLACIDLVNSRFADHLGQAGVVDRLPIAEWQTWFLGRHALVPDVVGDIPETDLRQLRQVLTTVLDQWGGGRRIDRRVAAKLDVWVARTRVRPRVSVVSGRIAVTTEAVSRDWPWVLAAIALSAAELMATADHRRYKRCGNPDCSWAYYDTTLNGSKQYCSTTPCGTLMRVRRHRAGGD
ncbi:MAG TPA: CGNR zinc finger domain-containing protein [Acidimicrobiales bacterium]|jgi:hypothetical protein|nr:CGNR zinc finger domain-containing protein [Acidimicrobiales bacterium]